MEARTAAAREIATIGQRVVERGAFGSVRVLGVDGELTTDRDGDAVVRLRLKLADPAEGRTTWPLDDVDAVRQEVERLAADFDLPYLVTEFYPETLDPEDDSAADEDHELARALDRRDKR